MATVEYSHRRMSRNNSRGSPTVIGPLTEVRPTARSRFVDARRLGLPIKQPPRAESEDNKDPDQHEQCFHCHCAWILPAELLLFSDIAKCNVKASLEVGPPIGTYCHRVPNGSRTLRGRDRVGAPHQIIRIDVCRAGTRYAGILRFLGLGPVAADKHPFNFRLPRSSYATGFGPVDSHTSDNG